VGSVNNPPEWYRELSAGNWGAVIPPPKVAPGSRLTEAALAVIGPLPAPPDAPPGVPGVEVLPALRQPVAAADAGDPGAESPLAEPSFSLLPDESPADTGSDSPGPPEEASSGSPEGGESPIYSLWASEDSDSSTGTCAEESISNSPHLQDYWDEAFLSSLGPPPPPEVEAAAGPAVMEIFTDGSLNGDQIGYALVSLQPIRGWSRSVNPSFWYTGFKVSRIGAEGVNINTVELLAVLLASKIHAGVPVIV